MMIVNEIEGGINKKGSKITRRELAASAAGAAAIAGGAGDFGEVAGGDRGGCVRRSLRVISSKSRVCFWCGGGGLFVRRGLGE